MAAFGDVKDMPGVSWECLEISEGDWGVSSLEVVEGEGGLKGCLAAFFLQFWEVTNEILDIFR